MTIAIRAPKPPALSGATSRAGAFADDVATDEPITQVNVGQFAWSTNDLTSVKDIVAYVNTALEAAVSAQENALYVQEALQQMEDLNTQYRNVLNEIDSMYTNMVDLVNTVNFSKNEITGYVDECRTFRDQSQVIYNDMSIIRDQMITFAMQAVYKSSDMIDIGATINIDPLNGSVQRFNLTAPVATVTIATTTDPAQTARQITLIFNQGTGANKMVWPSKVKWNNGRTPIFSYVQNKSDVVSLLSWNSGTSWYGFYNGGWFNA